MTPLERATRALHDQLCTKCLDDGSILIEGPVSGLQLQMAVRAVFAANREPSEAMIDRGQEAINQCVEQGEPTILADAGWQAMINAMLEEG